MRVDKKWQNLIFHAEDKETPTDNIALWAEAAWEKLRFINEYSRHGIRKLLHSIGSDRAT